MLLANWLCFFVIVAVPFDRSAGESGLNSNSNNDDDEGGRIAFPSTSKEIPHSKLAKPLNGNK